MGNKKPFKKRNRLEERQTGGRGEPLPNSFLIISEGTKTEPFYIDGLKRHIDEHLTDNVETSKPIIKPEGQGAGTMVLVEKALQIRARQKRPYNQVWVVFDKDNFDDFDEAIAFAESNGLRVAWNNKSFEYWLLLHFNFCDSALQQDVLEERLSSVFRTRRIDANGYKKNNVDVFEIVTTHGSLPTAIKNAQKMEEQHPSHLPPSQRAPSTTMFRLMEELKPYLPDLFSE